jgi:hypothetical protein
MDSYDCSYSDIFIINENDIKATSAEKKKKKKIEGE